MSEEEWRQAGDRAWEYYENHTVLNSFGLVLMMKAALTKPEQSDEAKKLSDTIELYSNDGMLEEYGFDGLANHLCELGYRQA